MFPKLKIAFSNLKRIKSNTHKGIHPLICYIHNTFHTNLSYGMTTSKLVSIPTHSILLLPTCSSFSYELISTRIPI